MRVREFPRLGLTYEAETPKGRFYRWAKDEPQEENVPSGGNLSSTVPGGFEGMTISLPRGPGVEYADLERLTSIRALGASGDVVSEVRLAKAPRTSGDSFAIGPEAEGWYSHLGDDPTAAEIYRDIDLGNWIRPSRERMVALSSGAEPASGNFEVHADVNSGLPSLRLHIDGAWASAIPRAEAWYDAGSANKIGAVYYDFSGYNNTGVFELIWRSSSADDTTMQSSGDLFTATTGSGTAAPAVARRYFVWSWKPNGSSGGTDGVEYFCDLRRLAVEGDHGLTKQGAEPDAGLLASDVIPDVLSRWAPLLRFSTGTGGSIRPSEFAIPHLVFREQTTSRAMVEEANRYELRPWAVWENRTFYYQGWGDRGRRWRARIAPSQLAETGPSTERLRNGVLVRWQDVDGSTRLAGPIGSGCDVEDASLEDLDPENPANQRSVKMYGQPLDMGGVSVASEAVRVGALYLERLKEADSSGQAQIVGVCEDDRGVLRPASQVRAGDLFEPIDAADKRPRRIIRAAYEEASLTTTITLDAPPDEPEDLLAQLGVSVADIGL